MAEFLTPKEKREQIEGPESPSVKAFAKKVAEALESSEQMQITVAIQGVPRLAAEAVAKQLREKGWDAKVVNDFRDGDYLDVKEPRGMKDND